MNLCKNFCFQAVLKNPSSYFHNDRTVGPPHFLYICICKAYLSRNKRRKVHNLLIQCYLFLVEKILLIYIRVLNFLVSIFFHLIHQNTNFFVYLSHSCDTEPMLLHWHEPSNYISHTLRSFLENKSFYEDFMNYYFYYF